MTKTSRWAFDEDWEKKLFLEKMIKRIIIYYGSWVMKNSVDTLDTYYLQNVPPRSSKKSHSKFVISIIFYFSEDLNVIV